MFKKDLRLRSSSQFKAVFAEQKKSVGKGLIIYFKSASKMQVGIVVSKKVDKRAVQRNKIKRRIREIFRANNPDMMGSYVVVARAYSLKMSFEELKEDWLKQLAFLKRKIWERK